MRDRASGSWLALMAAWMSVIEKICLWAQLPPSRTKSYRSGNSRLTT